MELLLENSFVRDISENLMHFWVRLKLRIEQNPDQEKKPNSRLFLEFLTHCL